MTYETAFLRALVWTLLSETAALGAGVYVLFRLRQDLSKSPLFSRKRILFAGFFASFATLPYLWFLLPQYISSYFFYALTGEIFVILLEALFFGAYFLLSPGVSLVLSLACNLVSLGVGKFLFLY